MPLTVPDQTLAAQIKTPDTLNTLSSIMNFKNQQQQLQTSQLDYQKRDAELAKTIQLRDLAASPAMQNPDGTMNRDKFANEAFKVDPTQGATAAQGGLTNQTSQIANETSKFALHKDYTGTMLQTATGLLQDPRITADPNSYDPEQAQNALTEAFQQARAKGVPENQALLAVAPFVNAIHQPGAVRQLLANAVNGQLGAQGQATQNLVPAGSQQAATTDVIGNQAVLKRDQFGNVQGMSGMPAPGQPATPGQPAPSQPTAPMPTTSLQPGEREQIPVLAQETTNAKNTMLNAPLMHTTNHGILQEIDKVSATGQAGPAIQKLNSVLGLKWGSAEEKASSYDIVGKYLERNALTAAASMGPQTNAGLEAQIKANGSLGYNPTAIKAITKLNDAIVSGTEAYYPGLQKAIAANPQKGVLAKSQFDQQWASVFTPTVMQLYNAAKSGDKAEIANIIKQNGGQGSAGVQDLVRRSQGIEKLMKTGSL